VRRSPEVYVRRPVFIGDICALVRRQRILDEDALAEGEELESNILSQDFALVRSSYQKFTELPFSG
jgi:hypothetical protein